MQKKRPRGKGGRPTENAGGTPAPATAAPLPPKDDTTPKGHPVRVRTRLVAGVAFAGLAVVGAGVPGVLAVSADLTSSQELVTLSALDRQAVTLAHSLSDERDEVVAWLAAGGENQKGDKADRRTLTDGLSARVDRQMDEIREEATGDHAELGRSLATVPTLRRTALEGKSTPVEVHGSYTAVIDRLHALASELSDRTPPRAADGTRATADLGHAVEQASAVRGLLLAALSVPRPEPVLSYDPITGLPVETDGEDTGEDARTRDALTAAAQQARVRELGALADFDQSAGTSAREKLAATVTGSEVKTAEAFLARLTDQPRLTGSERRTDRAELEAALTARIEQMRGAETALAADRLAAFEQLRDDDVTALEIRIALLGGLLVITVGVLAAISRTLTRPLAVLRIGAARLADGQGEGDPVRFTGRNDEFAQVVRSLNALHGQLRELAGRVERLDSDRGDLAGSREAAAAELAAARAELGARTAELTGELERLRHTVHHTFVNLSLRTLGLVERQLGVIEKLEEREQDPERLATLFKLDHMATVMRRHSENLLVLAGTEHGQGHVGPVPLVDVLRAAVSEIERYDRVVIQSLPPHAQVAGFAADDLSHLVAELLENATSFSPPDAQVEMSGWLLESGEIMLSVQDTGIGMTPERLDEVNAGLADPAVYDTPGGRETEGLGLRVAALLAARHGVRLQLREHKQGGVTAVVVVPAALLPEGLPAAPAQSVSVAGQAPAVQLPGSVAEANSNALPPTTRRGPASRPQAPDAPASGAAGEPSPEAAAGEPGGSLPGAGSAEAGHPGAGSAEAGLPAAAAPGGSLPQAGPSQAGPESTELPGTGTSPAAAGAGSTGTGTSPAAERPGLTGAHAPDAPTAPESADPFVAAAERAVRAAEAEETHERNADGEPVTDGIDQETFTMRLPRQPAPADDPAPFAPQGHTPTAPAPSEPAPEASAFRQSAPAPSEPAPAPGASQAEGHAADAPEAAAPAWDRITDKGLPKRTPRNVAPAAPAAGRTGTVDADALRRRLGGFQQGARDGRRDAEAEITQATHDTQPPHAPHSTQIPRSAPGAETTPAPHTGRPHGTAHRTDTQHQNATNTPDAPDTPDTEAGDTVEEARS
ncbi:nitrate- and nitrite sensing domain-containing protein [Streptomyces zhihengii]|uniref:nitrate- and nitrite sensing domain-containing protein n=1 Tax=Streptomyces zhihengii TaxID=1818004 RepID=UPI0036B35022